MNYTEYEEAIGTLSDELKRAATANPYDPDIYNDVVYRINALYSAVYQSRRRRPWAALISVLVLLLALLVIVYLILNGLYNHGS